MYIHISDVRRFKTCRQQWDFSSPLRQNLRPIIPNRHLSGGIGFHRALESYYQPDNPFSAEAAMETYKEQRIQDWCDFMLLDPLDEQITQHLEMADLIEGMLGHYFTWAPQHDDFTPLGTELKFDIPLLNWGSTEVRYSGKADGICQTKDKKFWLLEHKTCASYPDMNLLFLDEQCTSYQWAASVDKNFTEMQPAGTIYTFALKRLPAIPKVLKSGELSKDKSIRTTAAVYAEEVERQGLDMCNYADFLAGLEERGNDFFQRVAIQRPEKAMAVFESDMHAVVTDMLNVPYIYPSPNWWACKNCAYRVPCSMCLNDIDSKPYLEANFTHYMEPAVEDAEDEEPA